MLSLRRPPETSGRSISALRSSSLAACRMQGQCAPMKSRREELSLDFQGEATRIPFNCHRFSASSHVSSSLARYFTEMALLLAAHVGGVSIVRCVVRAAPIRAQRLSSRSSGRRRAQLSRCWAAPPVGRKRSQGVFAMRMLHLVSRSTSPTASRSAPVARLWRRRCHPLNIARLRVGQIQDRNETDAVELNALHAIAQRRP